MRGHDGRIIKTDITSGATPLHEFMFKEGDLILYGNETLGYRGRIANHLGKVNRFMYTIVIPMLGEPYKPKKYGRNIPPHPTLNVAITHAIVTSFALSQLGYFKGFDPPKLRAT